MEWYPTELPVVAPSLELADPARYYVIDVRSAEDYALGHIPCAVNIGLRGRLETWTGIMVPWGQPTVVTGDVPQIKEALFRLHRVGYEPRCLKYEDWVAANMPIARNEMITPRELYAQMQAQESPIVVDVRLPAEWMGLRIGTVVNIPLNLLPIEASSLDKSQPVVAVCNSAYRSSLAVGVFERQGFQQASSMVGGGDAWIEAGLPVIEAQSPGTAAAVPRDPSGGTCIGLRVETTDDGLAGYVQSCRYSTARALRGLSFTGQSKRRHRRIAQQSGLFDRAVAGDCLPRWVAGNDGGRDPVAEDGTHHQGVVWWRRSILVGR